MSLGDKTVFIATLDFFIYDKSIAALAKSRYRNAKRMNDEIAKSILVDACLKAYPGTTPAQIREQITRLLVATDCHVVAKPMLLLGSDLQRGTRILSVKKNKYARQI